MTVLPPSVQTLVTDDAAGDGTTVTTGAKYRELPDAETTTSCELIVNVCPGVAVCDPTTTAEMPLAPCPGIAEYEYVVLPRLKLP